MFLTHLKQLMLPHFTSCRGVILFEEAALLIVSALRAGCRECWLAVLLTSRSLEI
jgi:hypothetical protein